MTTLLQFPDEILVSVMREYLTFDVREVDLRTQRRYPKERFGFPTAPTRVNKRMRDAYRAALSQFLWITLEIRTCGRPHSGNEPLNLYRRIQQKLFLNGRFYDMVLARLMNHTRSRFPRIRIRLDCCDQSQRNTSHQMACFQSRDTMDRAFIEFLNSVILRYPRIHFGGINLNGSQRQRAIRFMTTIRFLLRNVQRATSGPALQSVVPGVPILKLAITMRTAWTPGAQVHGMILSVLRAQMRGAIELVRTGTPQYLLLPEFLDTMNRHRAFFRRFGVPAGSDRNNVLHQRLLSTIAGHRAFICSGMAQYLLARENRRELQRHYTMPNIRPHNQWIFFNGELFWTPFLGSAMNVVHEGWNPMTGQLQLITSNQEVWCTVIQAAAELSLAFARAAIVVGLDANYKALDNSPHQDPMPDIRLNLVGTRDPTLLPVIDDRVTACNRHLEQFKGMWKCVEDLYNANWLNQRPTLAQWLTDYDGMFDTISEANTELRRYQAEIWARTAEARKQRQARINPVYILGRQSRRRKMRLPKPRKKQRLRPLRKFCREEFLRPLFLSRGQLLINYQLPPFIHPPQGIFRAVMYYPDSGRPFFAMD